LRCDAGWRARRVSQSIAERIDSLEAQLAGLPAGLVNGTQARALYDRLQQLDLVTLIDALTAAHDTAALRDLLGGFIQSATISERVRDGRGTTWARAAVTWTADAQALLDAGLLVLGAAPQPPAPDPKRERARDAARRCRARKAATGATR